MVAAGDNGLHRFEVGEALQEVEVKRDGILRRIRGIKDIAADEQGVDFFGAKRVEEPVEKAFMLQQAVTLDESSAEMPVGRMKDVHEVILSRPWLGLNPA